LKPDKPHPPQLFLRFFRWFCHPELKKYVEGDLMELYDERIRQSGKTKADLKFIVDVLFLFRPGIIRPTIGPYHSNSYAMFKNYFKITFRNLLRHTGYTALNITGFAIGIAVCIVIMLFVAYEKSFDNFQPENIYRLNEVQKFEGMVSSQKVALSMFPMGPTLQDEFPEIKNFTRIHWTDRMRVTYLDQKFYFNQPFFVDSTFLDLFNFELIEGNRKTALLNPGSVVLTKSSAEKLFGTDEAIGKTIIHYGNDTTSFMVTGVLQNIPQNSQLQFDALFSFSSIYKPWMFTNWGGNWLNTYLELVPGTVVSALEKKFPGYLKKYMTRNDGWKNYELFLLPLRAVHGEASDVGLDYLNYQKFDKKYTDIFLAISLIILLIACINFMNLSTARSAERAKEVGIRKSVGSHRWQLGMQFITESVILSMIALILAVILVYLFLPYVNDLSQRDLNFPLYSNPQLLAFIMAGAVITGVLSGLYPAAYLSAFQPIKVLKGPLRTGKNNSTLRNMLVVFQFSSAIFLMINTIFVARQLSYMLGRDPGFDREQVVNVSLDGYSYRKYDVLKQELLDNSLITGVTAAQDVLGSHLDQSGIEFKGDGPLRHLTATRLIVDPDYLNLYKIPLAYGRNFSNEPSANGKEYIINESLAGELLSENPGQPITSLLGDRFGFDSLGTIVGIAKDFNFNSLHNKIETLFMYNQKDWGFNNMSIKINGGKTKESLAFIQDVWKENCSDQPFEYQFLDDHFAEVYRADSQVTKIVSILTVLAFIISCLGLFGLASYSAERRVKEVGIRKVMGASIQNIVGMLSRDFLKHVLIASVIALPLAWFSIHRWLQKYAYHININWWIFILSVLIALMIALITTSYQALKAASANPVNSLRSE
jgi:putative ABC transport system permease protein